MKSNTALLKIAEKHLGQGGAVFRRWAGLPAGAAYCQAFVCYVLNEGGDASLAYNSRKVTYCPTGMSWCQKNLAEIPPYLAMPMDIIYFDWEPNNVPNHVGFVRAIESAKAIHTIEGNTSNGKVGGVVANKNRVAKYICGIFRPHYPCTFDVSKPLTVDGVFGYNSIAMLQKILVLKVDGILGKNTVKALQKLVGVEADGAWGKKTSKAVQKMIKVEADGDFGKQSVKAFQKWINAHSGLDEHKIETPAPKPEPVVTPKPSAPKKTRFEKANEWAAKIAKSGKYGYKIYGKRVQTHQCPLCHTELSGADDGWNCIGYAFAYWHHGAGIKCKCNCGVINDAQWNRILKMSDKDKLKTISELTGVDKKDLRIITNDGKAIPKSILKAGDLCVLYFGKKYKHMAVYEGNGKITDCSNRNSKGKKGDIKVNVPFKGRYKSQTKIAVRYIGK